MLATIILAEQARTIVVCIGCTMLAIGALALAPIWGPRRQPRGIPGPYQPVTDEHTRVIEFIRDDNDND